MIELTRQVRGFLDGLPLAEKPEPSNGCACWPTAQGFGAWVCLELTCRGEQDPTTGYFLDIRAMDQAVRGGAFPVLNACIGQGNIAKIDMQDTMKSMFSEISKKLPCIPSQLSWLIDNDHQLDLLFRSGAFMWQRRQTYHFSAAHRLHVASLNDEQNKQMFGKCNHPHGHGHNYKVEIALEFSSAAPDQGQVDAWVEQHVIQKVDHKFLNKDVAEFSILNPSVENIAQVIYQWLLAPMAQLPWATSVRLRAVEVWETEKTRARFEA